MRGRHDRRRLSDASPPQGPAGDDAPSSTTCTRAGEPIAALWAFEETIYSRFGYGIASWAGAIELRRDWGAFARPLERRGQTRFVTPDEAPTLFPPVYDALRCERPGVTSRSDKWWELRQRFDSSFEAGVSTSRLAVQEALGTTPQATAEIWRFLLDVDWTHTIEAGLLPPDHPLFLCSRTRVVPATA